MFVLAVEDIEELMPAHVAEAIVKALSVPTVSQKPVKTNKTGTFILVPAQPAAPHQHAAVQLLIQSPSVPPWRSPKNRMHTVVCIRFFDEGILTGQSCSSLGTGWTGECF